MLAQVLLQKVAIPTLVWPQAKLQGRNTAPPISRKLGWRFNEHDLAHQSKTQSSQQPVPPIRKLAQASYPHPPKGRQNENHNHRKLTKMITWTTALCNSMKLWAMQCGATRDGWVMVESSDKTWSTGEGNGKPLQHSCLENPMNNMTSHKERSYTKIPRECIHWEGIFANFILHVSTKGLVSRI